MIFSSSTEYAIRGLAELAGREVGGPLMLDELVAGTDLPRDFLAKVFQKLVHGGVLRSAKGRGGGFTLARPSHEITLMHIVEAIDGPVTFNRCNRKPSECARSRTCPVHSIWAELCREFRTRLAAYNFAAIAASAHSASTPQLIQLH